MPVSRETTKTLFSTVRDATIKVLGHDLMKNDAEAQAFIAIIKAYGGSPAGFIYGSPSRAKSTLRPPDIVLCHPDIGLLVIETKGHLIEDVQGIEAGSIMIRYQGRVQPKNVIRQVEDQMNEIGHDIIKLVRTERAKPLINCMIAFPNISESEWVSKGFDKAHPSSQLLFKDQITDQSRLKKRIANYVNETLKLSHKPTPLTVEQVDTILQVFGNSDVINEKRPLRDWVEPQKLGSEIDELVNLDKHLSREQKEYSRLSLDGFPRVIRGVAGSGKSIVLAQLVARHLLRQLDTLDATIFPTESVSVGVTCFNTALVDFLKRKIRTAYREHTLNENISSDVLLVTHLNDFMYKLVNERHWPINYLTVKSYPDAVQRAALYRQQIAEFAHENPEYYQSVCFDIIFVDEAQDLEPEEFKLLLDLIKPSRHTGEKPLIIFYDDAQNLYGRVRPNWKQDVGITVDVGGRSRVMRECFRNTRQVVELAFNILLGSQAPPDMRVQTRSYADVAYLKEQGLVEEVGDHFRVGFAEREGGRPQIHSFETEQAELVWLGSELVRLIRDEEVRPEDILVVFEKSRHIDYQALEAQIRKALPDLRFIHPFGDNKNDKSNYIFQKDCLTLSTVYGAKGYDAPIVFLVGADRYEDTKEGRAAFYVASTRAKLLLYVTGVTRPNSTLLTEAQKVVQVL